MIKKRNRLEILVMLLVFGMVFVSYVNGTTNIDYIRIINVTPNNNLIDGMKQQFSITVEYLLSTREEAIIYIGFNSYKPDRYQLVNVVPANLGLIVKKGRGVYTFNVTGLSKNWFSNGKFGAYANISPYPHGKSWNVLSRDIRELSF
jgi:hypothetical protein